MTGGAGPAQARAAGSEPDPGEDVFRYLVRVLTSDLPVKVAFICEVCGERRDMARTLALAVDGQFLENVQYKLAGTPCSGVYDHRRPTYQERGVAAMYPEDTLLVEWGADSYLGVPFFGSDGRMLGHVGVMSDSPLEDRERCQDLLRVFATRAGAELERRRGEPA